jgi:hypothetical protein
VSSATLLAFLILWWTYRRWIREDFPTEYLPVTQLQYLLREEQPRDAPSGSRSIPRILHITYANLAKIPQKVYDNLRQYAGNYEVRWYNDDNARDFLQMHFAPAVLRAFDRAIKGAHKADLLRYCLLYIHGGVYIDVKTVLTRSLDQVFKYPLVDTYLVHDVGHPQIYNGIIATYPRNPFFLQVIHNFILLPPQRVQENYHIYLRQMYHLLKHELGLGANVHIQPGRSYINRHLHVYLFQQECTSNAADCPDGLDRYGFCCYVYDHSERIIKVRYSDYPWT